MNSKTKTRQFFLPQRFHNILNLSLGIGYLFQAHLKS